MFIQLPNEICYLIDQIMILQHICVKTARMGYVSLPVFLPVESFIFYLPALPSCPCHLFGIPHSYAQGCDPLEFPLFPFPFFFFFPLISQHIHGITLVFDPVYKLRPAASFLIRNCFLFFCYAWYASILITHKIIPAMNFTDLHHWL